MGAMLVRLDVSVGRAVLGHRHWLASSPCRVALGRRSRKTGGRPRLDRTLGRLIREMAGVNPLWGHRGSGASC